MKLALLILATVPAFGQIRPNPLHNQRLIDVKSLIGFEIDSTTPPTNGQVWTYVSATGKIAWATPPGATGGEANTASNVGTAGVGLWDAKAGVDLQFRKLNAASSRLTITLDAGNRKVDIDISESSLNLANVGGSLVIAQIAAGSKEGAGAKLVTTDGSQAGCAQWASGKLIGTGSNCGSGGGSGDMLRANNLSDLIDFSAARANLGLGNSATRNVGTTAGTVAAGDDPRLASAAHCAIADTGTDTTISTPCVIQPGLRAPLTLGGPMTFSPTAGTGTAFLGFLNSTFYVWHNVTGSCTNATCVGSTSAPPAGALVFGAATVTSGVTASVTSWMLGVKYQPHEDGSAVTYLEDADGNLQPQLAIPAGQGLVDSGGTLAVDFGVVPGLATTNTFTNANDFSGASTTKPMKTGTAAPGTCTVGEFFYDTDATAGQNVYACTATNTWTLQGGGGSSGCWIDLGAVGHPTEGGAPTTTWTIPAGVAPVLGYKSVQSLTNAMLYTASATSSQFAYRRIPFPRNCTAATGYSFELTWWADATANQRFNLEYAIQNSIGNGSNTLTPTWTAVAGTTKAVTDTFANMYTDTLTVDLSSCTAGCHVLLRLARDSTIGGNGGGAYISTIALYK